MMPLSGLCRIVTEVLSRNSTWFNTTAATPQQAQQWTVKQGSELGAWQGHRDANDSMSESESKQDLRAVRRQAYNARGLEVLQAPFYTAPFLFAASPCMQVSSVNCCVDAGMHRYASAGMHRQAAARMLEHIRKSKHARLN